MNCGQMMRIRTKGQASYQADSSVRRGPPECANRTRGCCFELEMYAAVNDPEALTRTVSSSM